MNTKSLHKLEYDKIIELLSEHASSPGGKERCLHLLPKSNLLEIERMQEETDADFKSLVKKR